MGALCRRERRALLREPPLEPACLHGCQYKQKCL
jgi:hypothetical protein